MPLSFKSENHGNIAFGFFNIESDMLLLENYFFFADDFCKLICKIADNFAEVNSEGQKQFQFKVYNIPNPNDIGDLMGAIHGMHYTGFIGSTYKLFPFPENPEDFKQNPEGSKTQDVIKELIGKISQKIEILVDFSREGTVCIGLYIFNENVFYELIKYVDKGGYPRWKDDLRPGYVLNMKDCIQKSNIFFKGLFAS
jgi:hypothetical protein